MKVESLDIFRYETKFFIENASIFQIENIIKLHPANFKAIYQPRQINNIYFDTKNLDFYFDNVDGSSKRIKVRLRWYGNLDNIVNPILEIKIKSGNLNRKELVPIKNNQFSLNNINETIKSIFKQVTFPEKINNLLISLLPKLVNSYQRKYFLSFDKRFRLTIDSNQKFFNPNSLNWKKNYFRDDHNIILEIKYSENNHHFISEITNVLPFRVTKSSKYVRGMQFINS